MEKLLLFMSPRLPKDKPVHLLGIGDAISIEKGVLFGIDTFDSSYPSKCGRHGSILTKDGPIYIRKSQFKNKFDVPLVPGCTCTACSNYSQGYVHHLFKAEEPIGKTLGTIHNLNYMFEKMKNIRERILNDEL